MKDNVGFEGIIPISRRNVLKAGAVTAVGVGLFSGTAAATNPRQINFCGCTQVCVDRAPKGSGNVGGVFKVILAKKEDGEWMFPNPEEYPELKSDDKEDFCFEAVGKWDGYKVIAVRPGNRDEVYCNPGRCAQKALAVYLAETGYSCGNDKDEDGVPEWGEHNDIADLEPPYSQVVIVHGQCGKPGRDPNPGNNPGGDDDVENGEA